MWVGWLHNHSWTGYEIYLHVFHGHSPIAGRGVSVNRMLTAPTQGYGKIQKASAPRGEPFGSAVPVTVGSLIQFLSQRNIVAKVIVIEFLLGDADQPFSYLTTDFETSVSDHSVRDVPKSFKFWEQLSVYP